MAELGLDLRDVQAAIFEFLGKGVPNGVDFREAQPLLADVGQRLAGDRLTAPVLREAWPYRRIGRDAGQLPVVVVVEETQQRAADQARQLVVLGLAAFNLPRNLDQPVVEECEA